MAIDRQPGVPPFPRAASDGLNATDELKAELRGRLQEMGFLPFEECLCKLLSAMGYDGVAMLGRRHFLGKNRAGGADIVAFGRVGVSATKVIVQVKQYAGPVQARYVDELRGTMLRLRAGHGIIVSTSAFSSVAVVSARVSDIAPIRLIDGDALVRLLVRYRVGVRSGLVLALKLDDVFFAGLGR